MTNDLLSVAARPLTTRLAVATTVLKRWNSRPAARIRETTIGPLARSLARPSIRLWRCLQ